MLVLALVLYVAYRFGSWYSGPGGWAAGQSVLAVGIAARNAIAETGLRKVIIPRWITAVVLGLALVYVGLLRFFGQRERGLLLVLGLVAYLAAMIWLTYGDDLIFARHALMSLTMAVLFVAYGVTAWRYSTGLERRSTIVTWLGFSVAAITYAGLGLASATRWSQQVALFVGTAQVATAYLSLMACAIVWTFGLVLLLNRRLQSEVHPQAKNLKTVFATSPDAAVITRLDDGKSSMSMTFSRRSPVSLAMRSCRVMLSPCTSGQIQPIDKFWCNSCARKVIATTFIPSFVARMATSLNA